MRYAAATIKVGYIAECLRALLPNIDAGLITNFGNKVRAETFDDFLGARADAATRPVTRSGRGPRTV